MAYYKNDTSCTTVPQVFDVPSTTCQVQSGVAGVKLIEPLVATGTCAPTGTSTPVGDVKAKDPVTVCCMP